MKNEMNMKGGIIFLLVILSIASVHGLGVSIIYTDDRPLEIMPGEQKDVFVHLSNSDVDGRAFIQGNILEGNDIAVLDAERYSVNMGESKIAKIKISIPASASIGDSYHVLYKFSQVDSEGSGQGVAFSRSFQGGFNINVVEEIIEGSESESPAPSIMGFWLVIIIAAIIILMAFIIIRFMKKKAGHTYK